MAASLEDRLWSMTDLAEMIDERLPRPGKRGRYKNGDQQWRITQRKGRAGFKFKTGEGFSVLSRSAKLVIQAEFHCVSR
jgi:hypothetical protein